MESASCDEFEEWLKTRPESVQMLAADYPPGWYRIRDGAPYGISCPGTVVQLYSYTEDGQVGVVVHARHKRPEALAHEQMLAALYGTEPPHERNIWVCIDPCWMERCEPSEIEELS